MRCAICLGGNIKYKTCCNIHIHKQCQKKWGENCIICRMPIKDVKTTKKYMYIPPEPELTREELQEQIIIMQQIQRRNTGLNAELAIISARSNSVQYLTSFFETF
jgi:hypothetical protein